MKNRKTKFLTFLVAVLALSFTSGKAQIPAGYFGETLEHKCNASNQWQNYTLVDFTAINADITAKAIITKVNYTGTYVPEENFHSGIFYTNSKWAIYKENGVTTDTMAFDIGYNVLAPSLHGSSFQHTSTAGNISGNVTMIDDPSTNNNPNALVFITHNWGQTAGVYNNHATGVFYSTSASKWGIYNEDLIPFPAGAIYNVFVPDAGNPNAFVHTVMANTPTAGTPLNNPLLNGKPNAKVFVTRNFNPGGITGSVYNTSPICVFYYPGSGGYWFIANSNDSNFDSSAAFNVLVAEPMNSGIAEANAFDAQIKVFPNPSSSEVSIGYELKEAENVSLKLYNMEGHALKTIFEGKQTTGSFRFTENVNELNSGAYYFVLNAGGQIARKPLMVVK